MLGSLSDNTNNPEIAGYYAQKLQSKYFCPQWGDEILTLFKEFHCPSSWKNTENNNKAKKKTIKNKNSSKEVSSKPLPKRADRDVFKKFESRKEYIVEKKEDIEYEKIQNIGYQNEKVVLGSGNEFSIKENKIENWYTNPKDLLNIGSRNTISHNNLKTSTIISNEYGQQYQIERKRNYNSLYSK